MFRLSSDVANIGVVSNCADTHTATHPAPHAAISELSLQSSVRRNSTCCTGKVKKTYNRPGIRRPYLYGHRLNVSVSAQIDT